MVLGSLWVSQVLSGRESGRYLIVIASMERTERGLYENFSFIWYSCFLSFSSFQPLPLFAGGRRAMRGGGVGGGPCMKSRAMGGGGRQTTSSFPKFGFSPSAHHIHPPPPLLYPSSLHLPPPVQNEKSVIFIKRPTKYYLHSSPKDRILFRGDGIRHLFSNFIPS